MSEKRVRDDRPWLEGEKGQSVAEEVRRRSLRVPGARSLTFQSKAIQKYAEQRLKMRARVESDQEGCTFAISFAPSGVNDPNEQFCLLTHGSSIQIWEMSGIYTRRRSTDLHAAKLVQTHRQHTDLVSAVAWMPASFQETYANLQPDCNDKDWKKFSQLSLPPYFSASFDKKIKMHRNGECIGTIAEHDDWVRFMDVDHLGTRLITGSVSSNIFGWDIASLKADWSITPAHQAPPHLSDSLHGINSVNGLQWMNGSTTTFASGAGDGSVKVWDARQLDSKSDQSSCVGAVVAHSSKLNNLQWLKDNRFLMTSGRDDVIRLLDIRMLRNTLEALSGPSNTSWNLERLVLREYTGHSCSGYNVQASLYDNDARICTGSRDGKIYIYNLWSGQLIDELPGTAQPTHLVVPLPERCGPGLISSTATSCQLFVWAPTSSAENTPQSDLMPQEVMDGETALERARHEALERTFQQFGDRFLRALRNEGPSNRSFFDEDVQAAYTLHLRDAFLRYAQSSTQTTASTTASTAQSEPLPSSSSSS